jgi:hypothetical protein
VDTGWVHFACRLRSRRPNGSPRKSVLPNRRLGGRPTPYLSLGGPDPLINPHGKPRKEEFIDPWPLVEFLNHESHAIRSN